MDLQHWMKIETRQARCTYGETDALLGQAGAPARDPFTLLAMPYEPPPPVADSLRALVVIAALALAPYLFGSGDTPAQASDVAEAAMVMVMVMVVPPGA